MEDFESSKGNFQIICEDYPFLSVSTGHSPEFRIIESSTRK
jgi:hypothetical protein